MSKLFSKILCVTILSTMFSAYAEQEKVQIYLLRFEIFRNIKERQEIMRKEIENDYEEKSKLYSDAEILIMYIKAYEDYVSKL